MPQQIRTVHELLKDIASLKIGVVILEEDDDLLEHGNKFKGLTLFEIGECLDTENDLSHEEYDEYDVFIENSLQIIPINYFGHRYLPKDVQQELDSFEINKSKETVLLRSPSVILVMPGNSLKNNNTYVKSNSDAFSSWQSFKESAHSLQFISKQWLKENSTKETEAGYSFNKLLE